MIEGVAIVAFGLYAIGIGLYLVAAPRAQERLHDQYVFRTGLIPTRFLWASIPTGSALAFIGLATIFASGPLTDWFMRAAAIFILLGIVAIVWSADWIRPRWARRKRS